MSRRHKPRFSVRVKNAAYSIRSFLSKPFRTHRNKKLCKRYPFLSLEKGYFDSTFLDCMPEAWKKDFGIQMCEEIRNELIRCSTPKVDWLKEYSLCQVKEKYGTLRWYDNGQPVGSKIEDIINKYEDRSGMICICCGRPAKYMTHGWISFQCEKCFKKYNIPKNSKNKEEILRRSKLYSDNIPYRTIYNEDGSTTRIEDSPYLEEMKKLWPDKRPEDADF